jgi:hypothetical protein
MESDHHGCKVAHAVVSMFAAQTPSQSVCGHSSLIAHTSNRRKLPRNSFNAARPRRNSDGYYCPGVQ